jgi:hypothetical protein
MAVSKEEKEAREAKSKESWRQVTSKHDTHRIGSRYLTEKTVTEVALSDISFFRKRLIDFSNHVHGWLFPSEVAQTQAK